MMFEIAKPDEGNPAPAGELGGHLLTHQLREGVVEFGESLVVLVDGGVAGLLPVERDPDERLARGPHHPLHAKGHRGREHVVGAHRVDAEGRFVGEDVGRRNGGQMDDGVGALQRVDRLTEIGQVGVEGGGVGIVTGRQVDVADVVSVLGEVGDDGPSRPCRCRR